MNSGRQLTEEDLDWFTDNGMGIIAPRSDYYLNMKHDAIWGVDLYDEPPATMFPALQERVQELYAQDPNRFPLINLLPMYASPEQLGGNITAAGICAHESALKNGEPVIVPKF